MTAILSFAVRLHRAVFVAGTALLAVGASLLAKEVHEVGNWLVAVGAGFVMLLADVLREVEEKGKGLAASSGKRLGQTRADVLESQRRGLILTGLFLGCALVALGFLIT